MSGRTISTSSSRQRSSVLVRPLSMKPARVYRDLARSFRENTHNDISAAPRLVTRSMAAESVAIPIPLPALFGATYSENRWLRSGASLSSPIRKTLTISPVSTPTTVSRPAGSTSPGRHNSVALASVIASLTSALNNSAYESCQQAWNNSAIAGKSSSCAERNSMLASLERSPGESAK